MKRTWSACRLRACEGVSPPSAWSDPRSGTRLSGPRGTSSTLDSDPATPTDDRDTNILRIEFVAAEIVRHGGVAICAAVSPYRATRSDVRSLVGSDRFVEVFVDTPIEVCEARDSKGMYAKARRGELKGFTGVDDPYEPPLAPELTLDTVAASAETNARRVLEHLVALGFVRDAYRAAEG